MTNQNVEKAQAAVFVGVDKPFELRTYPLTPAPTGMARLRLAASGVCGTDIHIHRGKLAMQSPMIIGHEFVGQVEEISEADSAASGICAGDYAIVDIATPCGTCKLCRDGDDANCINMVCSNVGDPDAAPHFWGGYAEYNYSPIRNLVKIPEGLDPKMVCVYACAGPTALHAFRLAREANFVAESAKVAVVQGLGPVGTFAVAYLASLGIPHIVALTAGDNPAREETARSLGATEIFNLDRMEADDIIQKIRALGDGIGADLVFEASGNPQAVPQGMRMLRNRGVYLIPGQYSNSGSVEIQPQLITFNALRLIGSSQYSLCDVADYLDFLKANTHLHAKISALTTSYTVSEVNKAFEDAKAGKNVKTVLVYKK